MKARKYELIILGASGFSGACIVKELVRFLKTDSSFKTLSWAVAGRSEMKLKETLQQVSDSTGVDLEGVDKMIVDTSDMQTLRKVASQCNVVLSIVGPYWLCGESVVKACLAEATCIVDVSFELHFLNKVQVLYDSEARERHVHVIQACGADILATDCGIAYLQRNFEGEINSIECYTSINLADPKMYLCSMNMKHMKFNIGTWKSALGVLANLGQVKQWYQKASCKSVPKLKYRVPRRRWPLHFSKEVNGWCIPFPTANELLIQRSQYCFLAEGSTPLQYHSYLRLPELPSLIFFFGLVLIGIITLILAQFTFGLHLLEKYAHFFSFGMISNEGSTEEEAENVVFSIKMIASGWCKNHGSLKCTEAPNKKMKLEVAGTNPGYHLSPVACLQSALTVLYEREKMPSEGGVYTPGVAFADTTIIERLQGQGVKFRIYEDGN